MFREAKFIYIQESPTEGILIAEDGGVLAFHHNGEHITGTSYGKVSMDTLHMCKTLAPVFKELWNGDETRYLLDFEGCNEISPSIMEEAADWLYSPRNGKFFDNVKIYNNTKKNYGGLTKEKLYNFLYEAKKYWEELELN